MKHTLINADVFDGWVREIKEENKGLGANDSTGE
jgi:hypothetical protein